MNDLRIPAPHSNRFLAALSDFRSFTLAQKLLVGTVIAGYVLMTYLSGHWVTTAHMDLLRRQFHLPADVAYAEFTSTRNKSIRRPTIEGIVRLTPEQLERYMARLDDPTLWRPQPLPYDGTTITGPYSADALTWRAMSRPVLAGGMPVQWGELSRGEMPSVRRGRVLCFAVRKERIDGPSQGQDEPQYRYDAVACQQLARTDRTVALVVGALDHDTRTLHMLIR